MYFYILKGPALLLMGVVLLYNNNYFMHLILCIERAGPFAYERCAVI